ncbi:hypothetical protein TVAG_255930 [Trichomonas vaginalis G3]|uniref:Surface antigen BspA-like n=1 Tax=Trichomonas vaginalis (strain ATCC PRA-98 / G3) TaxID=412133 RepID=A2DYZ0_TRIV3|nr:ribonuclease inhibitor domain-containing protein [Trichomonas vaginalis G3]EAY14401.1 hypothetical protein TVAG_255930 [Trichomonas vaginalis G3]KAI5501240.1 ribonuclease inhibitor domain-containing protein [Trichomonas vaginalis G3]|eukprot:XP_001326624.1 hypothetical protein [Trichomonas vaginalis G3]
MEYLFIPTSVKEIGLGAFFDANISKIEFASDSQLKVIISNSFSYTHLKEIILSSNLEEIEKEGLAYNLELSNITFLHPKTKTLTIKTEAIVQPAIKSIYFPQHIIIQSKGIFAAADLEEVIISEDVNLSINCFSGCPNIICFNISNSKYNFSNGFLVNEDQLIYVSKNSGESCSITGDYEIPNPAFQYSENLKILTISEETDNYYSDSHVIYSKNKSEVICAAG